MYGEGSYGETAFGETIAAGIANVTALAAAGVIAFAGLTPTIVAGDFSGSPTVGEVRFLGIAPVVSVVGDISGSIGAIEAPDIASILGTVPFTSSSAIADPNILVVVVEFELGQL